MGYFSDSRRNWAGAFWADTAIPLVLDQWNPIWDESGWWEEQFGALFAPLGPSGGNDYLTPDFWAGCSSETVGRRGSRTSPKVSTIVRGTCGAQSSNLILQKNLPWTPPPPPPLNIYLKDLFALQGGVLALYIGWDAETDICISKMVIFLPFFADSTTISRPLKHKQKLFYRWDILSSRKSIFHP